MIRRSLLRPFCFCKTSFRLPFINKRCFRPSPIHSAHDQLKPSAGVLETDRNWHVDFQSVYERAVDRQGLFTKQLESIWQRMREIEPRFVCIKNHQTMQLHCGDVNGRTMCEIKLDNDDNGHPPNLRISFLARSSCDQDANLKALVVVNATLIRGMWTTEACDVECLDLVVADRDVVFPIADRLLSEIQNQSAPQLASKIALLNGLQQEADQLRQRMVQLRHLQLIMATLASGHRKL